MGLASKPILESWKEFDASSYVVEYSVSDGFTTRSGDSATEKPPKVQVLSKTSSEGGLPCPCWPPKDKGSASACKQLAFKMQKPRLLYPKGVPKGRQSTGPLGFPLAGWGQCRPVGYKINLPGCPSGSPHIPSHHRMSSANSSSLNRMSGKLGPS